MTSGELRDCVYPPARISPHVDDNWGVFPGIDISRMTEYRYIIDRHLL